LVVRGGKGGLLVVQPPGVGAGQAGEAHDGVAVDADEAFGLADAAAVGDVGRDGPGLVIRQAGVEQGGALALGEAGLAGLAVGQPALGSAVAGAGGQVAVPALAEVGTRGRQAAEGAQVVHDPRPWSEASGDPRSGYDRTAAIQRE
jgi:hypothetical protein